MGKKLILSCASTWTVHCKRALQEHLRYRLVGCAYKQYRVVCDAVTTGTVSVSLTFLFELFELILNLSGFFRLLFRSHCSSFSPLLHLAILPLTQRPDLLVASMTLFERPCMYVCAQRLVFRTLPISERQCWAIPLAFYAQDLFGRLLAPLHV